MVLNELLSFGMASTSEQWLLRKARQGALLAQGEEPVDAEAPGTGCIESLLASA